MVALRVHLKGRRPSSDGASPLEPTCCFRDSEKWPFKILESKGMGPLQSLEKSMLCSENRQQVRFSGRHAVSKLRILQHCPSLGLVLW